MRPILGDGQTERPTVQIAQLLERLVRQPFNGSEQDGVVRCLDRPGRNMERPTAPEIEQTPICLVHASVPYQKVAASDQCKTRRGNYR